MPATRGKAAKRKGSTDDLAKQLARIQEDIAELGDQLAELAADRGRGLHDRARDAVGETVNGALRSGRQAGREALAEARRAEAEFERVVADRPIVTVAIAAGLGYLIGFLSRRS